MKTYTQAQLQQMSLKEITVHNAELCSAMDVPATKRFSTKPAAIKKTLANQIAHETHIRKLVEAERAKATPIKGEKLAENPVVTKLEKEMLHRIFTSEYISVEPTCADDVSTYVFSVAETKADGGVLSSLVKRGLIAIDEDIDDLDNNGVNFTEAGYEFYKTLDFSTPEEEPLLVDELAKMEEELKPEPAKAAKPAKATPNKASTKRLVDDTTVIKLVIVAKETTAFGVLQQPLKATGEATVKTLIDNFVTNYKQKRGTADINEKFARDYITGAIRGGYLAIKG